uniref:Secreted protein n=1 Tax=Arundo donax TaxID=35708 RepID=A0A0A9EC10_ARUDO
MLSSFTSKGLFLLVAAGVWEVKMAVAGSRMLFTVNVDMAQIWCYSISNEQKILFLDDSCTDSIVSTNTL